MIFLRFYTNFTSSLKFETRVHGSFAVWTSDSSLRFAIGSFAEAEMISGELFQREASPAVGGKVRERIEELERYL